jgi:hypothetical protein
MPDLLLPLAPPEDGRYQRVAVTRARNLAAAEGRVSSWAWDDIDDPADTPAGAVRGRLCPRKRNAASPSRTSAPSM